jgi:hypothetical protein
MTRWLRCAILFALLSCAGLAVHSQRLQQPAGLKMAGLPLEVRLRRLHLVRPDLIPYPLDIEVFC